MRQRFAVVALGVALLAGAVAVLVSTGDDESANPSAGCPADAPPNSDAHVTWVPLVRLRGVAYRMRGGFTTLHGAARFGPRVGVVCYKIDATTDPKFQARDGDSTSLQPGTVVREIAGYRKGLAVGARVDGVDQVYYSERVPTTVRRGSDVYALSGAVTRIDLAWDGNPVSPAHATIDDPATVAAIVDRALHLPAPTGARAGNPILVTFHLRGGGVVELDADDRTGASQWMQFAPADWSRMMQALRTANANVSAG